MPTSYKVYQVDELSPPWLRDSSGEAWQRANGDVKDSLLARTKEAVKARFALLAPDDGLAALGAERQLPRAPGEASATYASRLKGAWEAWPWAGTAKGVLNALRDAGYPGVEVVIAKGRYYRLNATTQALEIVELSPGIVDPYWSFFWVFFPTAAFPSGWSGTPPGSSSDEANLIISVVKKWKAAHARFDRVVFEGTGSLWGHSTWGGTTWGGTSTIWEGPF